MNQISEKWVWIVICSVFLAAPLGGQPERRETGEALFAARCAGCHGLDGRGGEHAPNIATVAPLQQLSDAELQQIVRTGKAATGMPAFAGVLREREIEAVVQHLRILQGRTDEGPVRGDAEKGRALFFGKAQCSTCHLMHGEGGFIAADLTRYGATHPAAQIREAIVDPNKNFDKRRGTVVVTAGGKRYRGVIRNEDNFSLQVQTLDGEFHFFEKGDAVRIEREAGSLMPADYGSTLTSEELDDLVRYISGNAEGKSGGRRGTKGGDGGGAK